MTSFDFNGTIRMVKCSQNGKKMEVKMEGELEFFEEKRIPCYRQCTACNNDCKMKEKNENLKSITYYFIKLFFKTNKKYSCTQTKLGKLISILAFKYAIQGELLFSEPIYIYPPLCGTLIKSLTFIPKDIYFRDLESSNPDNLNCIFDDFDENVIIPKQYIDFDEPSDSVKIEIENVFRRFGAFPADCLGKQLNPIVEKIVKKDSDEIDLSLLKNMSANNFNLNDENINSIVRYIYQ